MRAKRYRDVSGGKGHKEGGIYKIVVKILPYDTCVEVYFGEFWDTMGMSELQRGTGRRVVKNTTQVRLLTW